MLCIVYLILLAIWNISVKSFSHETFLVLNKLDKLKKQKERAALEKIKPQIYKEYKSVKQIYFISAESGQGTENLERGLVEYLLLKSELEAQA